MATSSESNREHWQAQASKTARRINLGWWLDQLAAPLVLFSAASACGLLLLRRQLPETPPLLFAVGIAGMLVIVGSLSWLLARRKFETTSDSLVRLEATMHLRNALSAAQAGVSPWPSPQPIANPGVYWNWPRLLIPSVGALLLLLAGLLIPLSAVESPAQAEEPLAWKNIESDLNKLAEDNVVDQTYLEDLQKKIDELRAQKPEEWFSHSSLEATDSLRKSHESETSKLNSELNRAAKAIQELTRNAPGANTTEQARLAAEFDQALQGLSNGNMKPNPELLKQLQQLDPKNLGNLSPEQLQQLKDNLKKAAESTKGNGTQGNGSGDDWSDQLLGNEGNGEGDQPGNGPDGDGPGKGGVGRGPGHDSNILGNEHEKRATGDLTSLDAKDLSRATPGDLLQLQNGEHDIDLSPSQPRSGGDTNFQGEGGDRVWRESLDPSEQRAMKEFFNDTE